PGAWPRFRRALSPAAAERAHPARSLAVDGPALASCRPPRPQAYAGAARARPGDDGDHSGREGTAGGHRALPFAPGACGGGAGSRGPLVPPGGARPAVARPAVARPAVARSTLLPLRGDAGAAQESRHAAGSLARNAAPSCRRPGARRPAPRRRPRDPPGARTPAGGGSCRFGIAGAVFGRARVCLPVALRRLRPAGPRSHAVRRARHRLARGGGRGGRCRDLRRYAAGTGGRAGAIGVASRTAGRGAPAFPGARQGILLGTQRPPDPSGLRGGSCALWSVASGIRLRLVHPRAARTVFLASVVRASLGCTRRSLMPPRPSALFLAPEAPYPIAGGGSLRSASLLEYLGRHYEVDVVVFRQPGDPDPASRIPSGLVRRVTVLELPPNRRSFAARALRNAGRAVRRTPPLVDRFAGFSAQIARALSGARYDLGVIEHSWCAPYLEQVSPLCTRTVLDLHNVESVLHARCAGVAAGGVRCRAAAAAHRIFQHASRELERVWLPRFSLVLATSQADAELVRA